MATGGGEEECTPVVQGSRPQFGGRLLVNEDDVFKHNAWDNVEWGEKQEQAALAAVAKNSEVTLTEQDIDKLDQEAALHWDKFYGVHQNKFFKNRNWLFTEFPELAPHLANTFPIKVGAGSSPPEDKSSSIKTSLKENKDEKYQLETETSCNLSAKLESLEIPNSSDPTNKNGVSDTIVVNSPTVGIANERIMNAETTNFQSDEISLENDSSSYVLKESRFPGDSANYRVLEIGCGVGNTIFPLLQTNDRPDFFVYGGDFSPTAIGIIKNHSEYDSKRCNVFVLDATSDHWSVPFPPNSLDVITCIYALSAMHPDKYKHVAEQIFRYLKPGGILLFRDYGRYDLAQLRFKKGKCLSDNFYARGDNTRCYFFTHDEINDIFSEVGLKEKQNIVDRRLQVNRGKQLTMYRVWVQAKYTKPCDS